MAVEVRLPQWGEMTGATVVRWLKKEGEAVSKGEPLLEIETEKIQTEMEAPTAGTLSRILAAEGATASVGAVLAVIAEPGETVAEPAPSGATPSAAAATTAPATSGPASSVPEPRAQVEPGARRLARERGIHLHTIVGTGPHGRITVEDVQRAASVAETPSTAGQAVPLAGIRKVIAERMLRSTRETAPLTLTMEADVTALAEMHEGLRARGVTALHVIVKAAALTLVEHPALNAHMLPEGIRRSEDVNVGVAVALEQGLIVPVVRNADRKSVLAISEEIKTLSEKARQGRLTVEEVTGGAFTVTNLGALDVDIFTPILNQPEVGILGVGRIAHRPVAYRGAIALRSTVWLSLTFDHRAVDGAPAATFLKALKGRLQDLAWLVA
jgi:pyruvate dehydrogenase E2 component (dihydrolipoamide acetyltransferase)